MRDAFRNHWPEYLIEAWALGIFMISACLFTALLEHPASPVRQALPSAFLRRGIVGLAMGLTAISLIYSPWGKRSGAHMNPSVTLAFWRLGKIQTADAMSYILSQFLGGFVGVVVAASILGDAMAHPSVAYAVTVPGPGGPWEAWWGEFCISFLLMAVILLLAHSASLSAWTGAAAGTLVALYVLLEAPLSGMSMNPARTLASALPARVFDHLWIYFTAPPLAMLAAAEVQAAYEKNVPARRSLGEGGCAKLCHDQRVPCIFCGHEGDLT